MATRVKLLPRVILGAALAAGAFLAVRTFIVPPTPGTSVVPKTAALPEFHGSTSSTSVPLALPGAGPTTANVPEMRMDVMAWNAQMGLLFANGGPTTTSNSLAEKHGAKLTITREDDGNKMGASLLAFAQGLQSDPQPTAGVNFVIIMGDGSVSFLTGLNEDLAKLGPEYRAEVIGSVGFSRGEDKFMGPADWKTDPKNAKGGLVAGVIRDGDWNIALKWLGDNQIKNNPDEKTWDADALNWMAADDFLDAPAKYIAGACEDRPVVNNGKPTGKTQHVCVNGVVTWTPGDVNAAAKKGGLVSVVSTKEYRSQMPAVIVGIRKWDQANSAEVVGLLAAAFEGADQVKAYPAALNRAAQVAAQVYKEQDSVYWSRYYRGVTEPDATGVPVALGGSAVSNLADDMELFGLAPGSANVFAATYSIFGDIDVQQYPKLIAKYPDVKEVLNTTFLRAVAANSTSHTMADTAQYQAGAPIANVVSRKNWSIEFATNSDTLTPAAASQMAKLERDLVITQLSVQIDGHTDNTGDPTYNVGLSTRRAQAVANWLTSNASADFPASRFMVAGHGASQPLCNSNDAGCLSRNRRVVITLGTTGN